MLLNLKSHEVTSAAQFASRVGWELLIWDPTILATISEVANVVSRFFFWEPLYWRFYHCRKWWGASTKNIPLLLNNYVWCLLSFIIVFLVLKNFEKTSHCYCSFPRVVVDSVLVEKKSFQTWLSSIELVSLSKFYMLHGLLSKIALSAGIFLWKISCCREPLQIFRSCREFLQEILKQVPEFSI